ncbi:MAG: M48 family metallopeptidase [Limnobacter sp.]|nr:M48 family metallopeptidase [Limnobacter sp.]
MSAPISGWWYAAGQSKRQAACLYLLPNGCFSVRLVAQGADQCASLAEPLTDPVHSGAFNALQVEPRLGNTQRRVFFPDGALFETADNRALDRHLAQLSQGRTARLLHWLESHWIAVLTSFALLYLFMGVFFSHGVPAIAQVVAEHMPERAVQTLGKGTLDTLDKLVFKPSTLPDARQKALQATFARHTRSVHGISPKIEFRLGNQIGPNALALPDGHIVFTDELVNLAKNDLELVAILGHEMGHLQQRHLLRRLVQNSLGAGLLVLLVGDVSSASALVYGLPAALLELSFSRRFEQEADDFAHAFMVKQGISPRYFADIMLRLLALEQNTEHVQNAGHTNAQAEDSKAQRKFRAWFSTHPDIAERVQQFQK